MTLDALSESSLLRLEHYLNSNPYREYSMSKPYFPKTSQNLAHLHQLIPPQQPPSIVAYNELIDNQKTSLTLDRLAYKLRMKSDLNIDTLRDTHLLRRHRQRHYHPPQVHPSNISSNTSDSLSSIPPSTSTKAFGRQPTSITVSTNTMKTLINDDLSGIEGSAVRVGTLDDLVKQFRRAEFRLVRRPADYLESASTYLSSIYSTNDRTILPKSHPQSDRTTKQPQALTEYRFNAPTFPTTPSRTSRDPPFHQGLVYHYRTRERLNNTDFPSVHQPRSIHSPNQQRPRLNSLIIQERQPTASSSHDKRIQELREKSLLRTEKQLCVCNKLTIVDPFHSNAEQMDANLAQLQQQQLSSTNYIFPPVRPFGYLTKKPTGTDDAQALSWSPPPVMRRKKKHTTKKKPRLISENSLVELDKMGGLVDNNEEFDNSQLFNDTMKSMMSLADSDDEVHNEHIHVDLNLTAPLPQATNEQNRP